MRNFSRRLQRLEGRVQSASIPSMLIQFVDSEKRVTGTLLLASGKWVWTTSEGFTDEHPDDANIPPATKHQA